MRAATCGHSAASVQRWLLSAWYGLSYNSCSWVSALVGSAATLLPASLTAEGEELHSPSWTDRTHRPSPSLPIPELASRRAVAETLAAVRDFVSGGQIPQSWLPRQGHPPSRVNGVQDTHPFIALCPVVLDGQSSRQLMFKMSLPGGATV